MQKKKFFDFSIKLCVKSQSSVYFSKNDELGLKIGTYLKV